MKTLSLSIIAIAVTAFTFAQTTANFNGKITNPTGDYVLLRQATQKDGKWSVETLDSSVVEANGEFKMQIEISEVTALMFFDGNEVFRPLIKPGDDLYLTLNTTLFDETILFTGIGSERNNAIKNLALINEVIMNNIRAFDDDVDTAEVFGYMNKSFDDMASVMNDYKNDIDDFDDYIDKSLLSLEKSKVYIKKMIAKKRAFNKLILSINGSEALNIKGVDLNGKEVSLEQYKGKTIVIDFWAPWCSPCKREMPAFKILEEKYGNDVNFISLAVWSKKDNWIEMATDLDFKNKMMVRLLTTKYIID